MHLELGNLIQACYYALLRFNVYYLTALLIAAILLSPSRRFSGRLWIRRTLIAKLFLQLLFVAGLLKCYRLNGTFDSLSEWERGIIVNIPVVGGLGSLVMAFMIVIFEEEEKIKLKRNINKKALPVTNEETLKIPEIGEIDKIQYYTTFNVICMSSLWAQMILLLIIIICLASALAIYHGTIIIGQVLWSGIASSNAQPVRCLRLRNTSALRNTTVTEFSSLQINQTR